MLFDQLKYFAKTSVFMFIDRIGNESNDNH